MRSGTARPHRDLPIERSALATLRRRRGGAHLPAGAAWHAFECHVARLVRPADAAAVATHHQLDAFDPNQRNATHERKERLRADKRRATLLKRKKEQLRAEAEARLVAKAIEHSKRSAPSAGSPRL